MPYKLRASDGNLMWDIKDYIIKDNTIELITTMPDKTLDLFETEFLIVLDSEKANLLKEYIDDGQYMKIMSDQYTCQLKFSEGNTPIINKRKKNKAKTNGVAAI